MKQDSYFEVHIRPLRREEGVGYLATVPELPGCMSDGKTRSEALANVEDAIGCWTEAQREMGRQVPPPRRMVG